VEINRGVFGWWMGLALLFWLRGYRLRGTVFQKKKVFGEVA